MATSPNYSWSEPDNSSLVKNGAADIRTLGDAIDTSLWNVGFGQAGKNKLINADFYWNQRNSGVITTSTQFPCDRFSINFSGGTVSAERKTFASTDLISGISSVENYMEIITAGQSATSDFARIRGTFEDVYTLNGQTVTMSFYAKAATGTPKIAVVFTQNFGTGGSTSVDTKLGDVTISTTWTRYSITGTMPSVSGKTIGANNFNTLQFFVSAGSTASAGIAGITVQNNTFQVAAFQLEAGSKATPFQTASGGSLQAELAMCQRYYYRANIPATPSRFGMGMASTTTGVDGFVQFPVVMRTTPTAVEQSGTAGDYSIFSSGATVTTCSAVPSFGTASPFGATTAFTVASGLTAGQAVFIRPASTNAYLGWSAEL